MFAPTTIIRLLENVDITKEYTNTFSFSNTVAQSSFFIGKTKRVFTDFVYQRKEKTVKVGVNIESLWNVSYIMFQNGDFGSKWFYGFITDMIYINDVVTEIVFEIDVIQTWMFDIEIKDCYVEREHVEDDTIGKHRLEENLDIGDPIIREIETFTGLEDLAVIIGSTSDLTGADVLGDIYSGVYSGIKYFSFTYTNANGANGINNFITILEGLGKADAIQTIFIIPKIFIPNFVEGGTISSSDSSTLTGHELTINKLDLDGYIPKNNKLFIHPYNFFSVTNNNGIFKNYKYFYNENIADPDKIIFIAYCNIAPSPTVDMHVQEYNGIFTNIEETISLTGYPICSWTTDVYKDWIARKTISNAVSIGGATLSLGVGIATQNPIAIGGGILAVANSIGGFVEKKIEPDKTKGNLTGDSNIGLDLPTLGGTGQNFFFIKKTIRSEYAKMIDDYFHKFGYKVNVLKTPNLDTRLNWNYIKMIEANIFGNIPNNDLQRIQEIYRNGITFWHNDNVCDYDRVNSIL